MKKMNLLFGFLCGVATSMECAKSDQKAFLKSFETIIRAYDVRGCYGTDLSLDKIVHIVKQFSASLPYEARVLVGRDGRVHSPEISKAVIQTLRDEGIDVLDIGLVSTPVTWYAIQKQDVDAGIMITASHNPAKDNGLKIGLKNKPILGDDLWKMMELEPVKRHKIGRYDSSYVIDAYIENLFTCLPSDFSKTNPLKIIWDTAHGATGPVVSKLTFPNMTILYEKVDGTFPAHEPDPTKEENMKALKHHVIHTGADIGIGFDGDGDRLGVVDKNGRFISAELLISVWVQDILKNNPGASIVGDIKSSRFIQESVEKLGGKFIMCRTGHSYIKQKLKETGALFAGEASGHIFFADHYGGFDDGLYAALRLLALNPDLTTLHNPYKLHDIQIPCSDHKKFEIIKKIQNYAKEKGYIFNDLDGIRVEREEGWWLIRASNTQAILMGRCEAKTEETLETIKNEMMEIMKLYLD